MNSRTVAALALTLAVGVPVGARAQWNLGVHGGYDVDVEEFLLGMSVDFRIPGAAIQATPLTFSPGFEYYPGVDGATFFVVNLDAEYPFHARSVEPYVGGGLWIRRISVDTGFLGNASDTDVGLNLAGGARFGSSQKVRPFAEGVFRLGNQSTLVIRGGVSFQIGT